MKENFPITKQRELVAIVRLVIVWYKSQYSKISQSFEIEFTIPNKGKHELTIYLICDSYLDADKEMELL